MTSITPCLKPFIAGLNTGYGAFDTDLVTTQAYGTYALNGYATKSKRTKPSSSRPRKSVFNSGKGPNSLLGDGRGEEPATADPRVASPNTGHRGRQSPSAASRLAGRDEELGEGKTTTHTEVVAPDGNSIGSNDSRQMIIRKDISWAVEYSAP